MKAVAGLAVLMLGLCPAAMAQEAYQAPKTSWGAPDLQGVWSNASITKLTRMAGADKLVLTPAEAQAIETKDFNNARTKAELLPTDQSQGAPIKAKSLPGLGNYNAVWVDPGSKVAVVKGELRSSYIVDPPNGRVPMSEAGTQEAVDLAAGCDARRNVQAASEVAAVREGDAGDQGASKARKDVGQARQGGRPAHRQLA